MKLVSETMFVVLTFLMIFFSGGQSRELNANEKIEAVKIHNFLRRSVVPTASNMNELEYSDEIASVASKYLDKCVFAHMYGPEGYSENGRLASDNNMTRTVMNWFHERVYYDWNKPYGERCYIKKDEDNFLTGALCGHYTMLTTHTLTKVGCAINFCPTATVPKGENINNVYLIFCFYDKGPRDHPYTAGKPCTGCGDISQQYCRDGLCVKKTSTKNDCQLVCKRCQHFPSWIPGFCGCECDVGDDNDCSGSSKFTKDPSNCSPCHSLGTPCLNGGKDVSKSREECICDCPVKYSGKNCEITPSLATDIENSATIVVYGEKWYFGFRYPVDLYTFLRKWDEEIRKRIGKDLKDHCKVNQCESGNDDAFIVDMAEGYPILDDRGTLILKIFVKKNQGYLSKDIVRDVIWKNAAKETSYLFGHLTTD